MSTMTAIKKMFPAEPISVKIFWNKLIKKFFPKRTILSLSGIIFPRNSGMWNLIFSEKFSIPRAKSSRCIFCVKIFICIPRLVTKLPMKIIPNVMLLPSINSTLNILDLIYRCVISTACKKIVVNKKEKMSIAIIGVR